MKLYCSLKATRHSPYWAQAVLASTAVPQHNGFNSCKHLSQIQITLFHPGFAKIQGHFRSHLDHLAVRNLAGILDQTSKQFIYPSN